MLQRDCESLLQGDLDSISLAEIEIVPALWPLQGHFQSVEVKQMYDDTAGGANASHVRCVSKGVGHDGSLLLAM